VVQVDDNGNVIGDVDLDSDGEERKVNLHADRHDDGEREENMTSS